MTDPAIRIACAEACGFTEISEDQHECVDYDARSVSVWTTLDGTINGKRERVPDYLNDLNSCAQLRATLNELEKSQYVSRLGDVLIESGLRSISSFDYLNATARQHCEAFLKVKGLWQPGGGEVEP